MDGEKGLVFSGRRGILRRIETAWISMNLLNHSKRPVKRLLQVILICIASPWAYGQACGIYRIEYAGNLIIGNKENVTVHLPTTLFLQGLEPVTSEAAFIEVPLSNEGFKVEIRSHLTRPYNDISSLLTFYKKQSKTFIIKLTYSEGGSSKESMVEINWDAIEVSIVDDGKSGTLFKFKLKNISI